MYGSVQDKYDTILLHSASYHGRPEMARILLDHGVKSNAKNHRGETALHMVTRGRYDSQDGVRIAQLLLESGVDVNAQDKDDDSPLHSASYSGKLEISRVLLDHGAKAYAKNDRGGTPLHQVSQGEYESQEDGARIAQLLLDHGVGVNVQDKNSTTPLHLASWCGKVEIARLLVEHSQSHVGLEGEYYPKNITLVLLTLFLVRTVDLNLPQKDHEIPLHFACFRGEFEIARLLLDHGADVNAKNDQGETPLHLASRGEYDSPDDGVRVAELLLERGSYVSAQDNICWTPLHSASYNGKPEIIQVFLRYGAKVDAENDLGETPLHLVRQSKYGSQDGVHVARLLLDSGVFVNTPDKRNWTALHAASYYGRLEIAQVLLDHGGIAKVEDDQGKTPLHQVSQGAFESEEAGIRIAELLLERGLDANAQDKNRETALHVASRCGRLGIARVLLEYANVNNVWGRTPSHLGFEGNYFPENSHLITHTFLGFGADVNALAENNWTPLHSACSWGRPEIARLLLDHGAKANAETYHGETPLHAVANGKYESPEDGVLVARLLLERGADANAYCKAHWTPLHLGSLCGKLEIVRVLLDHGANSNAEGDKGETPLHRVSCGKCKSQDGVYIAQLLLERGVYVDARDMDQRTPLHVASNYGKPEIARLLLDHGAKVDAADSCGNTPLHNVSPGEYDSEGAGIGVARLLLERGGDVNGRTKKQRTPLHAASYYCKLEIARLLLDHGAKVDAADDWSDTPLHDVSQGQGDSKNSGVSVARLLLERGGDVNGQSKTQRTPLHVASYNGKLEIARLLFDYGAEVDAVDEFGETPLHDVSQGKCDSKEAGVDVARLLLERGGNVNRQSMKQQTPLHFASYYGKPEIVGLLLDHGAKVGAVDDSGETAFHDVCQGECDSEEASINVVRLLLQRGHGVDVDARQKDLRTPLHIASYNGKPEIVRLLLDNGAKVDAVDDLGNTPLQDVSLARGKYHSKEAGIGFSRSLLGRDRDVNREFKKQWAPLNCASYSGRLEIAQLLLDHGAKVNTKNYSGGTPLHTVSRFEYDSEEADLSVARLLLERGGNVYGRNWRQLTPLHIASYFGKLKIAQLLLNHGAKVDAVDIVGITPLHRVSNGSKADGVDVAQLLLECGGNVNGRTKIQMTPLHFASLFGKPEIVRVLLDHGAKVHALADMGVTAMHLVSYGRFKPQVGVHVTQLLLKYGGDANIKNKWQATPLHAASCNGKLEITQLLLDHGAKVDVVDAHGKTPLHDVSLGTYDSEEACVGVARLLLEHGGDVNGQAKQQTTPLHFASHLGKPEILRLFLDHGAKVDAVDEFGDTPLHDVSQGIYFSEEARVNSARLLLEHGADVNVQTKQKWTPLHFASSHGRLEMARLLLDHGAKVDAVNHLINTPLHELSQGDYDSEDAGVGVARLLLEHGADVNAKTRSGTAPLDLISDRRPSLTQFLRENGARPGENSSWTSFFKKR